MVRDDLGKRMKEYYEQIPKTKLMRRTPVIIRLDGKAFHTFTRGFNKPFDEVLMQTMQETTKYLCENIQGCVLGYTQSDEITLVLIDYQTFDTAAWYDYEVQKMCSVSASMATMQFNRLFEKYASVDPDRYRKALNAGAMFDSRVFNIPKEEVTNCIYWRQLDASRNSIEMVGQANFSHKELHKKSCNDIQDMLMLQKGINWNNFPIPQKRGTCVIKESYFVPSDNGTDIRLSDGCSDPYEDTEAEKGTWRTRWKIDKEIPIFKGEDRNYIEKLIYVGNN